MNNKLHELFLDELAEEKAADEKLTDIAKSSANLQAAHAAD